MWTLFTVLWLHVAYTLCSSLERECEIGTTARLLNLPVDHVRSMIAQNGTFPLRHYHDAMGLDLKRIKASVYGRAYFEEDEQVAVENDKSVVVIQTETFEKQFINQWTSLRYMKPGVYTIQWTGCGTSKCNQTLFQCIDRMTFGLEPTSLLFCTTQSVIDEASLYFDDAYIQTHTSTHVHRRENGSMIIFTPKTTQEGHFNVNVFYCVTLDPLCNRHALACTLCVLEAEQKIKDTPT
jgi:hypothetical protein